MIDLVRDDHSHGGRDAAATDHRAHTVPVLATGSPRTDRHVTLRSARLLAADLYVVAVVDGTGKLAEPKTITLTPDLDRARAAANRLVHKYQEES